MNNENCIDLTNDDCNLAVVKLDESLKDNTANLKNKINKSI
jgi:hypothetical protein